MAVKCTGALRPKRFRARGSVLLRDRGALLLGRSAPQRLWTGELPQGAWKARVAQLQLVPEPAGDSTTQPESLYRPYGRAPACVALPHRRRAAWRCHGAAQQGQAQLWRTEQLEQQAAGSRLVGAGAGAAQALGVLERRLLHGDLLGAGAAP